MCIMTLNWWSSSNHITLPIMRIHSINLVYLNLRRRMREAVSINIIFLFFKVHVVIKLYLILCTCYIIFKSFRFRSIITLVLLSLIAMCSYNRRRWMIYLICIPTAAQILTHHRIFLLRRRFLFNFLDFSNKLILILFLDKWTFYSRFTMEAVDLLKFNCHLSFFELIFWFWDYFNFIFYRISLYGS